MTECFWMLLRSLPLLFIHVVTHRNDGYASNKLSRDRRWRAETEMDEIEWGGSDWWRSRIGTLLLLLPQSGKSIPAEIFLSATKNKSILWMDNWTFVPRIRLEVLFLVVAEINVAFYLGGNPTGRHFLWRTPAPFSKLNLCFVNCIGFTSCVL